MEKIPSKTLEYLKGLISKANWVFAKTYADFAPHEYAVKGKCNLSQEEFEELVEALETYFVEEKFYSKFYKYTYIGDFKYWHMDFDKAVKDVTLINRAKV